MKRQTTLFLLFVLASTFSARGVKPAQASSFQAYAEAHAQAAGAAADHRVDGPNPYLAVAGSAYSAYLNRKATSFTRVYVFEDPLGNIRGAPWWMHEVRNDGKASNFFWYDPPDEFYIDVYGGIWIEIIWDGTRNIQGQIRWLVEDQTGVLFDVAVVYGFVGGPYFAEDENVGEWPYAWRETVGQNARWWYHPGFSKDFTPTGNARATWTCNGTIGGSSLGSGVSEGSEGNSLSAKLTQQSVGGIGVSVDKLGLLAPYIGLASTIIAATVATTIYVKRVKRRK